MSLCEVHGRLSFQGPQDRCCDEIPVGRGRHRPFPSLLFFFRSGQERRATITSCRGEGRGRGGDGKTDNDDRKNDDWYGKVLIVRVLSTFRPINAVTRPRRVIAPVPLNRSSLFLRIYA